MDGSNNKADYFENAKNRKLIPTMNNIYVVCNDPAAYYDIGKQYPVIDSGTQGYYSRCAVVDAKEKIYKLVERESNVVQRLCRGLILKNSLNNL